MKPFLSELLHDYGGVYTTPKNVELIAYLSQVGLYLGCTYLQINRAHLGLVKLNVSKEYSNQGQFLNEFPIEQLSDLHPLTPELLFEKYKVGEMWVDVILDGPERRWAINFKVEGQKTTIVSDTETGRSLRYSGLFVTPKDIIWFAGKFIRSHLLARK